MNRDGTFYEDAVKAYGEAMNRICECLADAARPWQAWSGDILIPNPFSPGTELVVDLNAADPEGFTVLGDDADRARVFVRWLFAHAHIDPLAELVKLRDAGCTFGGVPVLSVVKKP
jgi:hypothetical protein